MDEFTKQKQTFKKIVHFSSNALPASYLVTYTIAKYNRSVTHTIAESLVLPAAIDMVKIMFGKPYAKQLRQIPLADNTAGRRINDISEDICDQSVSRMRTSKVDEATDVAKDAHLIAYIRYVEETDIIEDILFCKPIPGKATSNEIFNIMDRYFDENDIMWNNCIGLCTDGARSVSRHKAGLQVLSKKKTPDVLWRHCMLHRAALVSQNIWEELNNAFTKAMKVINHLKNCPLKLGCLQRCVKIWLTYMNHTQLWLTYMNHVSLVLSLLYAVKINDY